MGSLLRMTIVVGVTYQDRFCALFLAIKQSMVFIASLTVPFPVETFTDKTAEHKYFTVQVHYTYLFVFN